MSNLGPYQDIVTEAARAGGVDRLIKQIEKNAVSKASPRIFLAGTAAGAALSACAWGVDRAKTKRRMQELQANKAKEELKDLVARQEEVADNEEGAEGPEADTPV